jgi:sulfite reductase alpha subunit-like flavoprotein
LLNKRLENLSALPFHPIGLGDDQQDFGYETEFDPWCLALIENLNNIFGKKLMHSDLPYKSKYIVTIHKNSDLFEGVNKNTPFDNTFKGVIRKLDKLTKDDCVRDVFHLELGDIKNVELSYQPGDIAMIYPRNPDKDTTDMLELLKLNPNDIIEIKLTEESSGINSNPFSNHTTAKDLIQNYVNINGIPNRYFCKIASKFTKNQIHKEKLELFAAKSSVLIN